MGSGEGNGTVIKVHRGWRFVLGGLLLVAMVLQQAPEQAPAAPLDQTCTPRPNVTVTTQPVVGNPGSFVVTVTANGANNTIRELRFDEPRTSQNAVIDVGTTTGRSGAFVHTLATPAATTTFTARRSVQGQPTTVHFSVVDGCGTWPTFAGGGEQAIPSPTLTPTIGPSPTRTPIPFIGNPPGTHIWWGGTSVYWEDAANWSAGTVPGETSVVCIGPNGNGMFLGYHNNQPNQPTTTIRSLHLEGRLVKASGTLQINEESWVRGELLWTACDCTNDLRGAGKINVTGLFQWQSGQLSGSGLIDVTSTGRFEFYGASEKRFLERTINNAGTATWNGRGNIVWFQSTFNNSGTFDIQGAAASYLYTSGNTPGFRNLPNGVVRKTGSGTTTIQQSIFHNEGGTVNAQAGILRLEDPSASGGTFGPGAGITRVYSGSLTVTNAVTITGNVEVNPGRIAGPGSLRVGNGGTLSWLGGEITGTGTIDVLAGGTLVLNNGDRERMSSRTINTAGTVRWISNQRFDLCDGATFNVQNGGVFDIQGAAGLVNNNCGAAPAFKILAGGTLRKSTSTGTAGFYGLAFNNGGTVQPQTGTLELGVGGTSTGGTFGAASGATLSLLGGHTLGNGVSVAPSAGGTVLFTNGITNVNSGVTFQGAGTARIANGRLLVNAGQTATVRNLELATLGYLDGEGVFNVPSGGTLRWTGGEMWGTGSVGISSGGTLAISTDASKALSFRTINNAGTVTWTGGADIGHYASDPGTFNNSGGVLNLQNTSKFQPIFVNNTGATVRKSVGAPSSFGGAFRNSGGTVETLANTVINFPEGLTSSGGTFQGAGHTQLTGGVLNVTGLTTVTGIFNLAGGALNGPAEFRVASGGKLNWTGMAEIGDPDEGGASALLTIQAGGLLAISGDIGPNNPEAKFFLRRTINNHGTITLSGTQGIQGYQAATINNHGLFDVQGDPPYFARPNGDEPAFHNHSTGTLLKSAGTGTFTLSRVVPLTDFGTLDVRSGTLRLSDSLGSRFFHKGGGTLKIAAGATFTVTGDPNTDPPGGALCGGSIENNGGTLFAQHNHPDC